MSVKWLTRIEVLDHLEKGFYESQGWRAERVHTMSRIDRPLGLRPLRAGRMQPVNGVAFAGDRGIRRVELSTDGGRTWREVRLDYPNYPGPDTNLTWALWSFDWMPSEAGRVERVVRATDGTGRPQSRSGRASRPMARAAITGSRSRSSQRDAGAGPGRARRVGRSCSSARRRSV